MLSFEKMQSNESFQSKGLTVILYMNEVWVCSHTKQDAFSKNCRNIFEKHSVYLYISGYIVFELSTSTYTYSVIIFMKFPPLRFKFGFHKII